MRILIVGINFYPELTGIGKYTGEMAAYLTEQGHQVRVITAPPYYPYWQVQAGYRWWQYRREEWQGVQVIRAPLWVPSQPSGMKRLIHHFSFAFSSIPALLLQMRWKPEVVFCVAPSILVAPFTLLIARIRSAKVWLHIQDFELDAASSLGIINTGSLLLENAKTLESFLLRRFDRVSTISESMKQRLLHKGVLPERAYLLPNWVNTENIHPISGINSVKAELDIPADDVVVLYSGNMGEKQGLDVLADAAKLLSEFPNIKFVFCGEGSARADLEAQCKRLSNVLFLPLQPVERLNKLLNLADIHVLPQRAGAADLVMPSKLSGMLASGKPVIATTLPGTEVAHILNDIGCIVPPGNPQLLASAILDLVQDKELRVSRGVSGYNFAKNHLDIRMILGEFSKQLECMFI